MSGPQPEALDDRGHVGGAGRDIVAGCRVGEAEARTLNDDRPEACRDEALPKTLRQPATRRPAMKNQHGLCVVRPVVDEGDAPDAVEGGNDTQAAPALLLAEHSLGRVGQGHELARFGQ